MATDMFLILPEIPGESYDSEYRKSIDIGSVTYGMSASGSPTDPVSGKPSVDQIVISRWVDSASLPLLRALAEGRRLETGRILIRRVGEHRYLMLELNLRGVRVRGVEVENGGGDERPSERVTLAFEQVTWIYTPISPTGTLGTKITYQYSPMA
jgi:type VI secretion system secreted protein Hcp